MKSENNGETLKINKSLFISINNEKLSEEYRVGEVLREGSNGSIRKVLHCLTKQERSMKIFKKKEGNENKILNEVNILSQITHPNILHIYEYFKESSNFYLITEYYEGNELTDLLEELVLDETVAPAQHHLSEKKACPILKQLMSAILYCHKNNIVHRNLKPESILLEWINNDEDKTFYPIVKLIGWGKATTIPNNEKINENIKSVIKYTAPEILKKENYNEKCDIWSIGVILYYILCGYPPFQGSNDKEISDLVIKGNFDLNGHGWDKISDEAKDLIKKMLTYDIEKRISAEEVLKHPWFEKFKDDIKINNTIAKIAVENMKKYKKNKYLEQAANCYIINKLVSKKEKEELLKLFIFWDKDCDGYLNYEELLNAFQNVDSTIKPDEVKNILDAVDLDGNKAIDYNEFLVSSMNRSKANKEFLYLTFQTFAKNKKMTLDINSVKAIFEKINNKPDNELLNKIIKEADSTGSGEISIQDFKKIMDKFYG